MSTDLGVDEVENITDDIEEAAAESNSIVSVKTENADTENQLTQDNPDVEAGEEIEEVEGMCTVVVKNESETQSNTDVEAEEVNREEEGTCTVTMEEEGTCTIIVKREREEQPSVDDHDEMTTKQNENGDIRRFTKPNKGLSMHLALDMLRNYKEYLSSVVSFWQPKGGEVYVFDSRMIGKKWKEDGYEWRNNGSSVQPKSNPTLRKVFSIVRSQANYGGDKAFQKVVYSLVKRPEVVLVHYLGDSSIPMAIPKRKSKMHGYIPESKKKVKEAPTTDTDDLSLRGLTLEETVDTLENYEEHLSMSRAIRPKGGEIYLFDKNIIGEDWKCDGYIWRNSGTRYMPSRNPIVRKNFYFIRTLASKDKGTREFKKSASFLLSRPNIILVHYMGDETVFTPRRHGNRKNGNYEFVRTCPSVIQAIKESVVEENATDTYHRLLTSSLEKPRNLKQIQSLKERLTRSTRHAKKKQKLPNESDIVQVLEINNPEVTSMETDEADTITFSEVDTNKVTDENIQPLLTEPLDTHPAIREAQREVLQQQKRNLRLQEEKLRLEIEKLEREKKASLGVDPEASSSSHLKALQMDDQAPAIAEFNEEEEQNVIYVNSESDLYQFAQEVYGDEPQYVYVQEGTGEVLQHLYPAAE